MQAVAPVVGLVGVLFLWLAIRAGFIGMALWFETSYAKASEVMVDAYRTRGTRCTVIGFVNCLAGIFIVAVLSNMGPLAALGILLFLLLLALMVIGFGICYMDLGERLALSGDGNALAWKTLFGGLVAETAFLVPGFGQLLCLYVLFRGFGATCIGLMTLRRDRSAAKATESAVQADPS